jgi:geranylgeranyl pyrophosphate synthase
MLSQLLKQKESQQLSTSDTLTREKTAALIAANKAAAAAILKKALEELDSSTSHSVKRTTWI